VKVFAYSYATPL